MLICHKCLLRENSCHILQPGISRGSLTSALLRHVQAAIVIC
jgi:hypothetical protein